MTVSVDIDTTPPGNPRMAVNGGVLFVASRSVSVGITGTGATDMKIWGDVDTDADTDIQSFEDLSTWLPYTEHTDVGVSASIGRKRLYARLRDAVGNPSPVFGTYVDYDPAYPQVSMVLDADVAVLSTIPGHDAATFSWDANVDFVEYVVKVMPTTASPYFGGSPVRSDFGSVNVAGSGSFLADTPITTVLKGADVNFASPGDGSKVIKVFIRDVAGRWSP